MDNQPTSLPPDPGRGRILVVEDDEQVRSLLSHLLRVTGHVVEEAGSVEEASQKLQSITPDLILLDMQLPGKSGLEFLPQIRSDPLLRLTPVIMIPKRGRDLLENMKSLSYALDIVHHHHERMDGSGYPDGLAGESIALSARVTTIADFSTP